MKSYKLIKLCFILLAAALTVSMTGCGTRSEDNANSKGYFEKVSFSELTAEFNDVRSASGVLLNIVADDSWRAILNDTYSSLNAIYYAEQNITEGDLTPEEQAINQTLLSALSLYRDAYDTMIAAADSSDPEIFQYAYTNFTAKVLEANQLLTAARY